MGLLREWYRRFQFARYAPAHWRVRPGTLDRRLFRSVVIENEYRLPHRFDPDDVILDVGAHIGSFALACLRRGARRVVCCEPDEGNFQVLSDHLGRYSDRVELRRAAVWRSDEAATRVKIHNPFDPRNTGAFRVGAGVQLVDSIGLDRLLSSFDRVRLLKLDCEGAEWPILRTTELLGRVEEIRGEYHLGPFPEVFRVGAEDGFSRDALRALLERHGFRVELAPVPGSRLPVGLFFATRPAASEGDRHQAGAAPP